MTEGQQDRPGTAVAAAVFGFVLSGLLLLAGVILVEGAKLIGTISDHGGSGSEFVFDGLVNFVAAALLIAGGVSLIGRKPSGRATLLAGVAIVLAEGIYWFGRFANGGLFFWVCLFVVPAIIAGCFGVGSATRTWLNGAVRR